MWKSLPVFILLTWNIRLFSAQNFCSDDYSRKLPKAQLISNNSLDSKEGLVYPNGTYWKDSSGGYVGCPCLVTNCIRICHEDMTVASNSSEGMSNSDDQRFEISVWDEGQEMKVKGHEHFVVLPSQLQCEVDDQFLLNQDEFKILINGTMQSNDMDDESELIKYFCLKISKDTSNITAITCIEYEAKEKKLHHYIYPICMLISVFFLALTLLAYILAPEMRTFHGRSVTSYSASLLLGFLGLSILHNYPDDNLINTICYPLAYFNYYFLLASFFWLNVMSFDIWWTFYGGFRNMTRFLKDSKRKKFFVYSVYSWTMPILLLLITLSAEYLPLGIPENWKPGITLEVCWFEHTATEFLYLKGPIAIILAMNLFFFISTAINIFTIKRETSNTLKRGNSRTHNENARENKERFKFYLKLFLVMGISWIIEIMSSLIQGPEKYWILPNTINALQGVFIFYFCVWTTKARNSLIQRFLPATLAARFKVRPDPETAGMTKSSEASDSSVTRF